MTICKGCAMFEPIVLIRGIGYWKKKTDRCELCDTKLKQQGYYGNNRSNS